MNLKTISAKESESQDESPLDSRVADQPSKANIRRTRLKMFIEEFQNEISMLEEKVDKYAADNLKLQSENEHLRRQLDNPKLLQMKLGGEGGMDGTTKLSTSSEMGTSSDISTIIKLSNKLQEMINVNDSITQVNVALRKDVKNLTSERDMHVQDITKLRDEKNFAHSRETYSKFASLKSKVDNYEREIEHWKNAMKRADNRIEDLRNELERYKRNSNSINTEKQTNDYSYNPNPSNGCLTNCSPLQHIQENQTKCVTNVGNAAEALQKLLSNIDSNKNNFSFSGSGKLEADGYPESRRPSSNNPVLDLSNSNGVRSHSNSPKQTEVKSTEQLPSGKEDSNELFSDPIRFPACVKLLELTKARQNDSSDVTLSTRNNHVNEQSVKHFPTSISDSRRLVETHGASDINQSDSRTLHTVPCAFTKNNHTGDDHITNNHANSKYGNHRSGTPGSGNYTNNNHSNTNSNMYWNNDMTFANPNNGSGGDVVHHNHGESGIEEQRSNKGDVDDDITIVLPSSDHTLIQQHTPDNPNREMLFPSPTTRNPDSSNYRTHIEQDTNPVDTHFPNEANALGGQPDYSYYPPHAYPVGLHPPMKKIKVEDVFK